MAPPSKKRMKMKPEVPLKRKSFKHKTIKISDHAISSQYSLPNQLEDDVPDFPRGGGSALSREEFNEVRAEVDAEFETEQRVMRKKQNNSGKKGKQMTHSTDDDFSSLFGGGITGKLPRFVNKITFKNISPGMKVWGVVEELNEKDVVISLPGGLRGLVRASDALDPLFGDEVIKDLEANYLSNIYHVGQLVSCIVMQVDNDKKEKGKPKIWLSLRLSSLHKGLTSDAVQEGMVLSAYVKSIEDHGYILNFGLSSFTGFMPRSSKTESRNDKVSTGQLVEGVIKSVDKTRKVVYLNSDPEQVSKCVTKDLKGLSIDFLVPGMMVNARVHSTLENGVMLSFLTYFTGTADIFNLQNAFPTSNWKDEYIPNKKVNARILFIDPSSRAVGLTMNPHLVHNKAPPSLVKSGDIFNNSKVIRIDRRLGLQLEIPSSPIPTPAYVSVSDVADKEVQKLEKSFREGSLVRVRVLAFRHLEGLAIGVLKTAAFESSIFTHSDVRPGMMVKAKVIAVESFGAIVQFAGGVKALCPLRHMSEFEIAKPRKKFQIGAELVFRVLGCKSKRITVTHKKTLVKSKLGILTSYADATEGLITHGWITKIEKHGCFVRFYNGVQGFAPRSELGLDPGSDTSSIYHVEQVIKCRVTKSNPASRRIFLSFLVTAARRSEHDIVKSGSLVSGIVERVTPDAVIVYVKDNGGVKGTISPEHLADHYGLSALMKTVLKPGYEFDQLLVLDFEGGNLILTAKYSLINSAQQLPLDVSQIHPQSIVHGYICNIIESGCFVRFLGRLTGFSPKNKASDGPRADLSDVFYIGQSVRSNIVDVNSETGRITLSLKQSLCSSTDASFIREYFLLQEKIANAQFSEASGSLLKWVDEFGISSVVEGKVHEVKDAGVVVSFQNHNDVFGFITHYQLGGKSVEAGSTVRAVVLDVASIEQLVDLSLKPEFLDRLKQEGSNGHTQKKKRKRVGANCLEINQTVNAFVEIVKENYMVLSLPEYNFTLGYASLTDYNTQKFPIRRFVNGQSVIATIASLPSPLMAGRLLLHLNSTNELTETSSSKRARKKASYSIGSLVKGEITEIKPLELRLKFGSGLLGRIHVTEVNENNTVEDPFSDYRVGQSLTARIVSKQSSRKSCPWELSIKHSALAGSLVVGDNLPNDNFNYSAGQHVTGFVCKVDKEWIWLTISRDVKAKVYVLDTACEPTDLQKLEKHYRVGKLLSGYVLHSNMDKKLLRLVLHPLAALPNKTSCHGDHLSSFSHENMPLHIGEGDVVCGRISKILPGVGGLLVQIDPHLYGKVHFTELADLWVSDPLSGYQEGQFVKCKVMEICISVKGLFHVDLSLTSPLHDKSTESSDDMHFSRQRVEQIEDLCPDMVVQGYVKNVTPKGCFIMLSRKLDAKILLSNLSDSYVKNPQEEFPVGKLVIGRVVSVDPLSKRVEVTLKTSSSRDARLKPDINDLRKLNVGDVITGRIRRVESFGLFIIIDETNMVGLCHISELSDDHIDSIETKYSVRERVTAKVLKVDEDKRQISLGMKESYLGDDTNIKKSLLQKSERGIDENVSLVSTQSTTLHESCAAGILNPDVAWESENHPVLVELESRSSIPPLEVPLDDMENSDIDNDANGDVEHVNSVDITDEKNKRAKKKAKEDREREMRAAEERLLEKDIPRNADEFEKLVRSSPNSSVVWIKYMAFMLSLADVEKARSIAERALRTINIREEAEKLNIWVAYFNLENEYGNPPEEAVAKVFQRALQYCDSKKVHLALLGMYERTEQHKFANELLNKMVKKFRHSCKVWLRKIQMILNESQDGVQSVINRALLCLPRHKHIKFISHTAILEFKCGVPDRGRSLFEGMLREYPKRTDLWSVYLDREIRLGDVDIIRALFERAISLSLPPKKMKFLFKKYLEYEKLAGDEERIESVKRKAMDYVESTLA